MYMQQVTYGVKRPQPFLMNGSHSKHICMTRPVFDQRQLDVLARPPRAIMHTTEKNVLSGMLAVWQT